MVGGTLKKRGEYYVAIRGLGRVRLISKKATKARPGRNPATGEAITIKAKPASKALKIRPGRDLLENAGL